MDAGCTSQITQILARDPAVSAAVKLRRARKGTDDSVVDSPLALLVDADGAGLDAPRYTWKLATPKDGNFHSIAPSAPWSDASCSINIS
jgi:hypothetical protein